MIEQWTADLVGKMHMHKVTQVQLANHLGVTAAYINMILNGKKTPNGVQDRLQIALEEVIQQMNDEQKK